MVASPGRVIDQMRTVAVNQVRALFPVTPIVFGVTLALLVAVGLQKNIPVAILMRDPAQTAHYPFYVGLISHIGILTWWTAATTGLVAGSALRSRQGAAFSWLVAASFQPC